jgi:hypothetical protein
MQKRHYLYELISLWSTAWQWILCQNADISSCMPSHICNDASTLSKQASYLVWRNKQPCGDDSILVRSQIHNSTLNVKNSLLSRRDVIIRMLKPQRTGMSVRNKGLQFYNRPGNWCIRYINGCV